jgi:predicted secreted hydrolase
MRARLITLLALALLAACQRRHEAAGPGATLSPTRVLGGADTAGFARAEAPRLFAFPADHGPHPGFRSEWWYFTGQLVTPDGRRRFGYQLTIFRQALAPEGPGALPRASAWATRQVYLGHLALADLDGGRFLAFERTAREGLRLAGATATPLHVWVEDWEIAAADATSARVTLHAHGLPDGVAATAPVTLALEVDLAAGRGPVLQGDRGLSRKGPEPGNASYYYSYTRLPTRGDLQVGESRFRVSGDSWLDREWSTSALGPELAGWDWLSLSLDDGRDLMVYRLRRRDGSATAESLATLIGPDRRTRLLAAGAYRFDGTGTWQSPAGARYPAGFRLEIPDERLTLEVTPLLPDQELRLGFRYWEGAVTARGRVGDAPLTGRGYLELTGYAR